MQNMSRQGYSISQSQTAEYSRQKSRILQKVKSASHNLEQQNGDLKKSSSCASFNDSFHRSLIDKIRETSNIDINQAATARMTVEKQFNPNQKLLMYRQNFLEMKEIIFGTAHAEQREGFKYQDFGLRKLSKDQIKKLQRQIMELKQQNRSLLQRIDKYECQLFISKQQIENLLDQIQEKSTYILEVENYLRQRQEEFQIEQERLKRGYNSFYVRVEQLSKELAFKKPTFEQCLKQPLSFQIEQVLSIKLTPFILYDKSTQKIFNAENMILRKQVATLQRNFKELKSRKDQQTQEMRKKFSKNLNYYKQLIIRFTSKSAKGKEKQEVLESTITQNSSSSQI